MPAVYARSTCFTYLFSESIFFLLQILSQLTFQFRSGLRISMQKSLLAGYLRMV